MPSVAEQLDHESRELFGIIASQFVDEFNPTNHVSEFDIPVDSSHPLFEAFPDIRKNSPWNVEACYIPFLRRLEVSALRLRRQAGDNLLFERPFADPGVFLPYIESTNRRQKTLLEVRGSTQVFPSLTVSRVLEMAGVTLPQVFTSPDDMLLGIANLRSRSSHWKATDRKTVPYAPLRNLHFRQHLEETPPNFIRDDVFGCAPQRKDRKGTFQPNDSERTMATNPAIMSLTAINEVVETSGERRQVVITFDSTFYNCGRPKIYGRILTPDKLMDAMGIRDINPHNSNCVITDRYDPLANHDRRDLRRQLGLVQSMASTIMEKLLM